MVGFALPLKGCTHPTTLLFIDLRFFLSSAPFSKTLLEHYKDDGQVESRSSLLSTSVVLVLPLNYSCGTLPSPNTSRCQAKPPILTLQYTS